MKDKDWFDVKASIRGNDESYARIVRQYEKQITRLVWRFTRNPVECEELVQEVFVEAYFSLKSYRGQAPFLHWLRKIATRVGYRFWKEQARKKLHLPIEDFDAIDNIEADSIDPSEAAQILHSLLARLPQSDRLVLTLMYFEQCSTKEIAERMGWTRAMVKMRAFRARKKIKEIAEREMLLEKLGWIR